MNTENLQQANEMKNKRLNQDRNYERRISFKKSKIPLNGSNTKKILDTLVTHERIAKTKMSITVAKIKIVCVTSIQIKNETAIEITIVNVIGRLKRLRSSSYIFGGGAAGETWYIRVHTNHSPRSSRRCRSQLSRRLYMTGRAAPRPLAARPPQSMDRIIFIYLRSQRILECKK
ncbi:hypothetical protein EVAR_81090_1 [Eumeta japonica]|uniref:Uncharacterized protein n=1 Tax=Eumeta variegata TaxID=151549 RepID=A0A4C1T5N8_EUMVA|nr:hypothetical protein EVAR_81090_1 [Eumeta japonica]